MVVEKDANEFDHPFAPPPSLEPLGIGLVHQFLQALLAEATNAVLVDAMVAFPFLGADEPLLAHVLPDLGPDQAI
jgi:hypothetical protein